MAGKNVEDIRFSIENLLSAENLMNNDSVKTLQTLLNKHVYGEKFLRPDGILGFQTKKAIDQYKSDSRYWGGHSVIEIDPVEIAKEYAKKDK
tara:strand:- start:132 stop:407 length:276 start_codon:yes stop_codon:yes gene_type:complete